uniref:Serine protease 16 n=1 Tax=Felis catus TaxID=9685 RepID=A0ABI7Z6F2_FELCA
PVKARPRTPSPRQCGPSLPAVPGGGGRSLRGRGAAAARGRGGSRGAAGGAGRLRATESRGGPGGAAGGAAGPGGGRRAVRRAGGSAAERAAAVRAPPARRGQPQPLRALPRAPAGSADVTCEDPSCPFSRVPALPSQLELCQQVFGLSTSSVAQAVTQTNSYYGGQTPGATQVLFVNGDTDPWHALSVTQASGPSASALLIPGASHCMDMAPERPSDSPSLRRGRQSISQQLQAWLGPAQRSQARGGD